MTLRIPWDEQEAALLVESYFWIENGDIDRKDAVLLISEELRRRAVLTGKKIDAVFRNANGINMRLYEIRYIVTGGTSGMKNTSNLFRKTVDAYINRHEEFIQLLKESKTTVEEKDASSTLFIEQLRMRPDNKDDELVNTLRLLNVLGRKNKVLSNNLQTITDICTLQRIKQEIVDNNALGIQKKKLYNFARVIELYEEYLDKNVAEHHESENISHGTEKEFRDWMKKELGLAKGSVRSYASTLNTLSSYINTICGIQGSIYDISDIATVEDIFQQLFSNRGFVELNSRTHNKFRRSLEKYFQFLKEGMGVADKSISNATSEGLTDIDEVYDSAEQIIKDADIYGLAADQIAEKIDISIWRLRKLLRTMNSVIEMPGDVFVHADNIIDLFENEEAIDSILQKQFARLHGYSNSDLLFEAASISLTMFLNDNGINTPERMYGIARYLFEKRKAKYLFGGDRHILEIRSDFPINNQGILMNYISRCGGTVSKNQCEDFLQKTKLTNIGVNHLLSMGNNEKVVFFGDNEYALVSTLFLEKDWIGSLKLAVEKLFENTSYVILREITPNWFETLPKLSNGMNWDLLLLQELIKKYLPEFRLITANDDQGLDTIRAGIVPDDSIICDFGDLVYARILEDPSMNLPQKMTKEALRQKLIEYQMIQGGELIYTMPKALNDPKFAWAVNGDSVLILKK